ncbi:thiosulfate oxidation carrier protein SoxY [Sulfuriflexus sp.]|uniref:thiosulfate oxidation carrier protein SoxY n=1 Tax=Sulfuriflexus sp. TaxID=2015443 RepID=UPI0028CE8345|nr:thiosulfate oxidation carrier protein SoxY [Sulfuriflexus sp.]MDT8404271.1 thiosulfate oxidation carrier protein SoxY [Sulfuriflexus sp.]
MERRTFLKGSMAGSAVAVAVGAGLLTPQSVLAAWPKAAFEAKGVDSAMSTLFGTTAAAASTDIKIKAPDIAENGAVVPVSVTAGHPGIESISILAAANASPLCASFDLGSSAEGFVSTRIKMGKTSQVIAVVKAGGKVYSASKDVKVTIGGCGG